MSNPFFSCQYSFVHAQRRITELEAELIAFAQSEPLGMFVEPHPSGAYKSYFLRLVKPVPHSVSGIVLDAVNALRSSLDQACYAVAIATGRAGKSAHFPFGSTLEEASKCAESKCSDLMSDMHTAILTGVKPYRTKNYALWYVNRVCNAYKHEIIPTTIVLPAASIVRSRIYPGIERPDQSKWDKDKHQLEWARAPIDESKKSHFNGAFHVALDYREFISRKPILNVLHGMSLEVERALTLIETTSRRLGYVA